jgi:cell division protease FtsH
MGFTKPFSEKTAELIDEEVHNMLEEAYERAKNILSEHRDQLDKLANLLIEKEVVFREDLENIYGKRPFDKEETEESKEKEPDNSSSTTENDTSAAQ